MTMEDWAKRLDMFLEFNERDILKGVAETQREKPGMTENSNILESKLSIEYL